MALYTYEAFSQNGKKISGIIDAASPTNVKEQLIHQKLFPIKIELANPSAQQSIFKRLFGRGVAVKEKILFTKQLVVLLRAGVPLLQAIELLVDQFENQLRSMLVNIKDELKQGSSFADALAQYPRTFETIYIQLVRAGEASGQLDMILDRLTEYLERREILSKKIKAVFREQLINIVIIGIVVMGLLTFIVPQMAENFASSGKSLPMPTQILLSISHFITGHYLILIVSIISMVSLYKYWISTPTGARQMDIIKLRLPLIGFLSRTNAVVQFSYTLGLLLEGGVNLSEALDIVVQIIDNRILKDALSQARDKIIKQGKIAQYLKESTIFPPIAIYLIETGEQSGQLDKMLLNVAKNYEQEVVELTDRLTTALKPIIFIATGLIVGFIIIAIALPIMQMGDLAGA